MSNIRRAQGLFVMLSLVFIASNNLIEMKVITKMITYIAILTTA